MALTEDQIIEIRRSVGNQPDDDVLNDIYARTNDVDELVLEVLEIRWADAANPALPANFAIPGEYSQDTRANIEALKAQVAAAGGGVGGTVEFIPPPDPRIR